MPVQYDAEAGFVIVPETCECGSDRYDTGCDAPDCDGWCCFDCGTGCDIDAAPADGRCARALAEESDEDYTGRINGERAAFGLRPLGG